MNPPYGGGQLKLRASPSPPLFNGSPSLIVCMPLAFSKVLKLTAVSNANGLWKTRDCRRVSGPSLLEVTSRLSMSIWSITAGSNVPSTLGRYACCPSTRNRQMPLCHASVDLALITDDDAKMLKMQHILLTMDSPRATASWITLLESYIHDQHLPRT